MGTCYAGPEWEWPRRPLTAILTPSCCRSFERKGGSSEQVSKVISYHMALPVSCYMATEISVSDFARCDKGIRRNKNTDDL